MHIQHIESTSGYTLHISGAPSPQQCKVDMYHPTVDLMCRIQRWHSDE